MLNFLNTTNVYTQAIKQVYNKHTKPVLHMHDGSITKGNLQ